MELVTQHVRLAKALGGATLLAIPTLASAAGNGAFVALVIDAGKIPGGLGDTIASSSGGFYQHASGSNFPPAAEAIAEEPELEYDSYVALGGSPSDSGYSGRWPWLTLGGCQTAGFFAPNNTPINNVNDRAGPLGDIWCAPGVFAPPNTVFSADGPSGLQSVFVARLTIPRGSVLIAPKVYVGLQTLESNTLAAYLLSLNAPPQFFPIYTDSQPPSEATFRLAAYRTAQVTLSNFGDADVYDLYVEAVPSAPAQQSQAPAPQAPAPPSNPAPPADPSDDDQGSSQNVTPPADQSLPSSIGGSRSADPVQEPIVGNGKKEKAPKVKEAKQPKPKPEPKPKAAPKPKVKKGNR